VFLSWEHEARRVIRGRWDFMPGNNDPDNEDEVFYEDGDEDKGEDEKEDDKMEDVPRAAVKLEAVLPDNYDEDAATTAAMATSLADEEAKWS
jgi:hypothetical protein